MRYFTNVTLKRRGIIGLLLAGLVLGAVQAANWRELAQDNLHDPNNPGIALLHQPSEALSLLPLDSAGNHVDWVQALQGNYIQPRGGLWQDKPAEVLDLDVIMTGNGSGSLPFVRFPHKAHTQWLDCGNCHEELFKSKAGATPVTMLAILNGEYCGRCHGAVSFPLTECGRCHSVPQDSVKTTSQ